MLSLDHLLAGFTKNIIEAGLHVINEQGDAVESSAKAEILICGALRENELKSQSSVVSSKHGRNDMTLSGLSYGLLVCVLGSSHCCQ